MQQLLHRLPLLFHCGQTLIPSLPLVGHISLLDLTTSLAMFKAQVYSSLCTLPRHSLSYCSVSVLYHLTSLLAEDHSITGHYGNCLSYLDLSITSLQCLPSGSLFRCAEYMAKARDSVRHRKRNVNNRIIDLDEVVRMNFLNRVEQLDQAMVAFRELLLISIIRQHTRHQMDSINRVSTLDNSNSSCELDSPLLVRRLPLNNNTLVDGKSIQKEDDVDGMNAEVAAADSSLSTISLAVVSTDTPPAFAQDHS